MSLVSYCQRQDLGLLRVTGKDAQSFLHAQMTQEINNLAPGEHRAAAWLSAKGRVRVFFDVVSSASGIWLVTEADNAGWLAEQLKRYVLRADVELTAAADQEIYSVCGQSDEWLAAQGVQIEAQAAAANHDAQWFKAAPACVHVFGQAGTFASVLASLPETAIDTAILAEIAAGRPAIDAALRERYVPQMLNLDLLGAISFTKGCYPGQEIVARTQNLGEVKRRLRRFSLGPGDRPRPGDGILADENNGQPVGEVNRVAVTEVGYELLAVVQRDAPAGKLSFERDGRRLDALPFVYDG